MLSFLLSSLRPVSASRRRRFVAGALLALALAPGTFVRSALPDRHVQHIDIMAVDDVPGSGRVDGFTREGVWQLTSPNVDFGGISALLALPAERRFKAFSDRGIRFEFPYPGQTGRTRVKRLEDRGPLERYIPDIESVAHDPATGRHWLGFEASNSVIRYSASDARETQDRPSAWRDWPGNAGPEAMTRLADGRFLVLPERGSTGVLHEGDPAEGGAVTQFPFAVPGDFAVTDMAALPDGRVLVLLRKVALAFPPFTSALGIFDPADIDEEVPLEIVHLVSLDELLPNENYEGLAIEEGTDGALTLWLVADDNIATFQRTLLARLRWTPGSP